jgi:hypothetical protein
MVLTDGFKALVKLWNGITEKDHYEWLVLSRYYGEENKEDEIREKISHGKNECWIRSI